MNAKTIRPWLYVTGAFLLVIAAWSSLIFIAVKHAPQTITVETAGSR
jgi:hypothetical protein